jgi:hypothetical protein
MRHHGPHSPGSAARRLHVSVSPAGDAPGRGGSAPASPSSGVRGGAARARAGAGAASEAQQPWSSLQTDPLDAVEPLALSRARSAAPGGAPC